MIPDSSGLAKKIPESFGFYLFLLFFIYVGWLHSAADSAEFALKTHRIREDNVLKVQGENRLGKMVYLGCASKIRY